MTEAERTRRREELAHLGITSKNNDGWCGVPCPALDCHGGEVETAFGPGPCGRCGGTGERHESALRDPALDA